MKSFDIIMAKIFTYDDRLSRCVLTWVDNYQTEASRDRARDVWSRFYNWHQAARLTPVNIRGLSRDTFESYFRYLRNQKHRHKGTSLKRDYLKSHHSCLKSLMQRAFELGYASENYMARIPSPKGEGSSPFCYLTKEESVHLLQTARSLYEGAKNLSERRLWGENHVMIHLYLSMGMRCSELANIRHCDFTRESPARLRLKVKGSNILVPRMPDSSVTVLADYIERFKRLGKPEDYVFTSAKDKDRPVARKVIEDRIKKTVVLARINKPITTHSFRVSFIYRLYKEGVALEHIQALVGHADLETTLRYIKKIEHDSTASVVHDIGHHL
jgi:site-specific recombinase XerD